MSLRTKRALCRSSKVNVRPCATSQHREFSTFNHYMLVAEPCSGTNIDGVCVDAQFSSGRWDYKWATMALGRPDTSYYRLCSSTVVGTLLGNSWVQLVGSTRAN